MSQQITLTQSEAAAVLLLLKSINYEGMNSQDCISFQATLANLGERIEGNDDDLDAAQYELWEKLGCPGWNANLPDTQP